MLQRLKGAKPAVSWLAVGFTEKEVGYVHVERTSLPKPKVKLCEIAPITQPNEQALKDLRSTNKLGRYPCTHVLSGKEYKMLWVDAPNVPTAELKQAVRWQIKDMLDFPAEQATIDTLQIPAREAGQKNVAIYTVAAPNTVISQRMALFKAAKLQLQVIDIPEMAQRNIAALFEQHGRALVTLRFDVDSDDCLLTFTAGGELYLTRRIEIAARQIMDADESRRQQYRERLVLELQRSLDHFERQFYSLSINELMLAPFSGAKELVSYLTDNLTVNVSVINLNDILDFEMVPELADDLESQGQFFLLLGAALREVKETSA